MKEEWPSNAREEKLRLTIPIEPVRRSRLFQFRYGIPPISDVLTSCQALWNLSLNETRSEVVLLFDWSKVALKKWMSFLRLAIHRLFPLEGIHCKEMFTPLSRSLRMLKKMKKVGGKVEIENQRIAAQLF